MRLIDADALEIRVRSGILKDEIMYLPGVDVYKSIENAPTIEAEPVRHGRWVAERCNHKPSRCKNPEKWVKYKCSECGYSNGRKRGNFCPNCGAKMDGGAD